MQVLSDEVLRAAVENNSVVISKWLKEFLMNDAIATDKVLQVLTQAVKHVSVDVIRLFEPPGNKLFGILLILCINYNFYSTIKRDIVGDH